MNKEQEQIIDEVYGNFIKSYTCKDNEIILPPFDYINDDGNLMSKNQFITNIKYNYWFSETWGLKIKERELSAVERMEYYGKHFMKETDSKTFDELCQIDYDKLNIPTKLITLTYNNETIENYE